MVFRYLFLACVAVMTIDIPGVLYGDQFALADLEVGGIGSEIEKLFLMAASIAFVVTRPRSRLNLAFLGSIVTVTFACAAMTRYAGFEWERYLHSLFTLVAGLLLLTAIPDQEDQRWVLKIFTFAPTASAILGLLYSVASVRSVWMVDAVGATRFQGSYLAPAWLGSMACTSVFCTIRLADVVDRRYFVMMPINCVILMLTAARMPLAVGTLMSLTALLLGFRGQFALKLLAVGIAILGLVPLLVIFGENLFLRFSEAGTSDREMLWQSIEPAAREFSDFGIGLGHQPLILPLDIAREAETFALHNEFLRISLELGTVGCVLFFLLLLGMLLNLVRCAKIDMLGTYAVAIGCFGLFCYTDNAFSAPSIFLFLPTAIMATKCFMPGSDQLPVQLADGELRFRSVDV